MSLLTKKRVAIMSRVSSDEQAKGYSLGIQTDALKLHCSIKDFEIVYEFKEDYSAKSFDRPAFNQFLKFVKNRKNTIDYLLFTSWDRFSRNQGEAFNMFKLLADYGVTAHAIEQPLDLSIPENQVMLSIYLALPEVDNRRRSIKIKGGVREAMKQGRWPRPAPKGYKNFRDENNKPIIIPSADAKHIKFIFKQISQGRSQSEVIKKLRLHDVKISKSQMCEIIRNPLYIGKIHLPKHEEEVETYITGLHEPLVDEETFNRVQDILNERKILRKPAPSTIKKVELPLRGSLACSRCNHTLTGSASRSASGRRHFYYHCNKCGHERFQADKVNSAFSELLSTITLNPKMQKFQEAILKDVLAVRIEKKVINKAAVEKEILALNERLIRVQDMYLDAKLSHEDFISMKNRIEAERTSKTQKMTNASTEDKGMSSGLKQCMAMLSSLDKLYENASLDNKTRLCSSIFPEKLFFDGKNCRTEKLNEVLLLILNGSNAFKKIKSGQSVEKSGLSALVEHIGVEPMTSYMPCKRSSQLS